MPLVKYGGVLMKMRSSASQAERQRDVAGVARDGPQRLAHALGQAGGAGREHDHRRLVLAHGLERGAAGAAGAASPPAARTPSTRPSASAVTTSRTGPSVRRRARLVVRQHDDVRLRLADQPVHVVLRQARVERDHDLAGEPGAQHADEELVVLLEHERDAGAAAAGGGQEGRRDPRRPSLHVRVGVDAAARAHAASRPRARPPSGAGARRRRSSRVRAS